jgi:hypothetical protein
LSCVSWGSDSKIALLKAKIEQALAQLNDKRINDKEEVKRQLNIMYELDQAIRQACIGDRENPKVISLVRSMDCAHTCHLKKILDKYEWFKISEFGKEASRQAWLLVQHADEDPGFQRKCLKVMKDLIPKNEVESQHFAYLYDRVALKTPDMGLKQKYGTQIQQKDDKWELMPFEGTLEDMNRRRREVGLDSVEDYLKLSERYYNQ